MGLKAMNPPSGQGGGAGGYSMGVKAMTRPLRKDGGRSQGTKVMTLPSWKV